MARAYKGTPRGYFRASNLVCVCVYLNFTCLPFFVGFGDKTLNPTRYHSYKRFSATPLTV